MGDCTKALLDQHFKKLESSHQILKFHFSKKQTFWPQGMGTCPLV